LFVHPASDQRLSSLLEQTASEVGITVVSEQETILPYEQIVNSRRTDWLYFTWSDPDTPPDDDSLDRIDPEKLQAVGEAFSLALTQIVRQTNY
jgi:hypothetical protein